MSTPWVVVLADLSFKCLRCGATAGVKMPSPIPVYTAAALAFCKLHDRCEEKDDGQATRSKVDPL